MVIFSLLLSMWLVASAFVLPHTPLSAPVTAGAAVVVFLAVLMGRERGWSRFVVTGIALAVSGAVVFVRGVPDVVALNHAIVSPLLLLLALGPLHPLAPRAAPAGHRS
jgi:hypothetical protein